MEIQKEDLIQERDKKLRGKKIRRMRCVDLREHVPMIFSRSNFGLNLTVIFHSEYLCFTVLLGLLKTNI